VAAVREKQAADERRAAESTALALVEERCRQEALLAAEADVQRRHEELLAAEADVQRCHEELLAAEAADVQHRHESAARATAFDAAIVCIRTEFALCAAPLDAILAVIACEEAAITTTLSPSRPTSYVDAVLFNMGGAHNRLCPSLARWLYHRLTSTAYARWFVPVPDLAVALVDATSLERPVRTSRWLQPTLNYLRGGVLRQLPSRSRERPHRRRKFFSRQRLTSWWPSRSIRRLTDANGLVAALVVATYLGHLIQQMRPFPPTLYQ
jgi:hypothetical protein